MNETWRLIQNKWHQIRNVHTEKFTFFKLLTIQTSGRCWIRPCMGQPNVLEQICNISFHLRKRIAFYTVHLIGLYIFLSAWSNDLENLNESEYFVEFSSILLSLLFLFNAYPIYDLEFFLYYIIIIKILPAFWQPVLTCCVWLPPERRRFFYSLWQYLENFCLLHLSLFWRQETTKGPPL